MAPTWRRVREAARGPVQRQALCPVGAVLHCLVLKVAWRIQARWRDPRPGRGAAAPRLPRPLNWPHCPWPGSSGPDGDKAPRASSAQCCLRRHQPSTTISACPVRTEHALSLEREPSTQPSERTRFVGGARAARGPGPMEAGAELEPAPRQHVRGLANGC